jgi:hypothetical protein
MPEPVSVVGRSDHSGLDLVHHTTVCQRRGVTDLAVLGDVTQQPAHDLSRAGLGQFGNNQNLARLRDPTDLGGNVVAQFCYRAGRFGWPAAQNDEGAHGLPGGLIRRPDHRGLGYRRMRDERGFDLGRR